MTRRLFLGLVLLLGLPGIAAAQHHGMLSPEGTRRAGRPVPIVPYIGARYSNVQGVSGSLLVLRNTSGQTDEPGGTFGAAEVGFHGASASVGTGRWSALSGGSLRATYLRTWGDGGPLAKGQGFVGGEARISFWWISLGAGWYHRVSGSAPGDRSSFAFTAGLGY